MKRAIIGSATAAIIAIAFTPTLAASPSQRECEAAGGTYTKVNGTVSCEFTTTENVGNSPNSQTTTSSSEESSQGTLNNTPKHEESSVCAGPGGSGDNSAHCPG